MTEQKRMRKVQGYNCMPLLKQIGNQIRKHRQNLDMQQTDFANALDISQNSVSQYENGLVDISICRLAQIADVLKTSLVSLIDETAEAQFDADMYQLVKEAVREVMDNKYPPGTIPTNQANKSD